MLNGKKITITEVELKGLVREILSEVLATTDLTSSTDARTPFATTDLRGKGSSTQSRDDADDSGDTGVTDGCGTLLDVTDLDNFPETARRIFSKFFDDLRTANYTDIMITSGMRSVAKQAELERTVSGPVAEPGKSYHQYGYAIDINITNPGGTRLYKTSDPAEWEKVAKIATNSNSQLKWQGSSDAVHFYISIPSSERHRHPSLNACGPPSEDWACKDGCDTPWKVINGTATPSTSTSS